MRIHVYYGSDNNIWLSLTTVMNYDTIVLFTLIHCRCNACLCVDTIILYNSVHVLCIDIVI